ncbi:SIS domain-containing protein [Streptomyces sp. AB3(2024)]|uniref:SIS domain-containing protein n=1 Tax=Streptomyces sp. AB3(2024) TaxID=3317321 RepID=UPI0035A3C6BF
MFEHDLGDQVVAEQEPGQGDVQAHAAAGLAGLGVHELADRTARSAAVARKRYGRRGEADRPPGTAGPAGRRPVAPRLSHSGGTREPRDVLAEAASRGATTIAVTDTPASPFAAHADPVLATRVRATGLRPEAVRPYRGDGGGS